jgi:NAD(P)-dependent dehydrogenase (short-subunit alcohol dehydrogenase family)
MANGKTALVTGGSRGIGRAVVELLAARGYRVMLTYLENRPGADEVVSAVTSSGGLAQAVQADAADPGTAPAVVRAVIDAWGRLDVLVNNAGTHLPGVTIADTPIRRLPSGTGSYVPTCTARFIWCRRCYRTCVSGARAIS